MAVNLITVAVKVSLPRQKMLTIENILPKSVVDSLRYFSIKTRKNVSESAHDEYVQQANELRCSIASTMSLFASRLTVVDDDNEELLSAHCSSERLRTITGIDHVRFACCKNSCIAYTGDYNNLHSCPFCQHPRCDEKNIPFQTFDYISLTHRLRLQFANKERAKALTEYPQSLEDSPWDGVRDYWDGELHKEHKRNGFFGDPRDIALSFSTDGLDLFKVGKYAVWPLLILILNTDPKNRVEKPNLILCGIIPGPRNPKDIQSFFKPLVDELKELANGISDVYDAFTDTYFTLHAHLVLITADLPAMAKIMGISEHGSYQYCRFCMIQGVHAGHVYCPLRTPDGTPPEFAFDHDPASLPLRNNATYRRVASETLKYETFNPDAPAKPVYGVAQFSQFYQLDTINFPRSFPNDVMHLVFQNVVPKMVRWWNGSFLKTNADNDNYVDELKMPRTRWREIGVDMERSLRTIPSSFGKALWNIDLYSGSFKASEWSNFLLHFSSVLLHGGYRLRQDLFEHYSKLVAAIDLAIDYEVLWEDIDHIKALLLDFVSDYKKLYYQYDRDRIAACLPTIHLLLHLHESISDCGPAWVFWQFPCERLCGMLKAMVHNRSQANRNLSLGILYREQYNHLHFATPLWIPFELQSKHESHNYTSDIDGHTYSFLSPRQNDTLSPEEITCLARYYANLLGTYPTDISCNDDFSAGITKWGRCRLGGDADHVSSEWMELRRDFHNARSSSMVRLSQLNDNMERITQFAKVVHFFVHSFQGTPRMLVYVRIYHARDCSFQAGCIQNNKIIRVERLGPLEVMCVTAIDEGIGVLNVANKQYLIVRREMLLDVD